MSTERSLELTALCAHDIRSECSPLTTKEAWTLIAAAPTSISLQDGVADVDADLRERALRRLDLVDSAKALQEQNAERGLRLITVADTDFPERLRNRLQRTCPVLLYVTAHISMLQRDGLGAVGSRNLDAHGVDVAANLGRTAAEAGLALVSGGARGADEEAMRGAIEGGGSAIGVLAHALESKAREHETAELIEGGLLSLISQVNPSAGFTVAGAMARNKIIYGLSRCTVVVASDLESGGTWAGATEAIRRNFGAVAVWTGPGSGPGNSELIARGGKAISSPAEALEIPPVTTTEQTSLDF